jgi:hypothetical protein
MAEMPEPIPEGNGRNPRGTGGGVPNVTAATDAEEPDAITGIIERMVEPANMREVSLRSLTPWFRCLNCRRTAVYGTVRTVVWEDGGGDPASYPNLLLDTVLSESFSLPAIFADGPTFDNVPFGVQ